MTDGLRKSHLRKAPQVGLSEVGLPDIYLVVVVVDDDLHQESLTVVVVVDDDYLHQESPTQR